MTIFIKGDESGLLFHFIVALHRFPHFHLILWQWVAYKIFSSMVPSSVSVAEPRLFDGFAQGG